MSIKDNANRNIIGIVGKPNSGKSTSLYFLEKQEEWVYLNCDAKEIPYTHKFRNDIWITEPEQLLGYIDLVENTEGVRGAIIDTLTHACAEYVRKYILSQPISKRLQLWGGLAEFYQQAMHKMKSGTKDYIILCHMTSVKNEETGVREDYIPIQGQIGRIGAARDFSYILTTQLHTDVGRLKEFENDLMKVTPREEQRGAKRVFQTEAAYDDAVLSRAPMFFWKDDEMYIDANISHILNRINEWRNN